MSARAAAAAAAERTSRTALWDDGEGGRRCMQSLPPPSLTAAVGAVRLWLVMGVMVDDSAATGDDNGEGCEGSEEEGSEDCEAEGTFAGPARASKVAAAAIGGT